MEAKENAASGFFLTGRQMVAFRRALEAWYAEHGRDLPWRQSARPDPYRIVVAEFMLQQTQVGTVLPYYARWMEAFPNFQALAQATESRVLSLWEGLGYYSRARNLHRLARTVVEEHEGRMPHEVPVIRTLPGVGDYTAGAIAAFAFDQAVPVVDGNIARVLARLGNDPVPIDSAKGRKALWALAERLATVDGRQTDGGHRYTSALMELGAMVCLPRKPLCMLCPVKRWCQAIDPESLPRKKQKIQYAERLDRRAFVVDRARRKLLLRHNETSPWRGLSLLPEMPEELAGQMEPDYRARYAITRYRVSLEVYCFNRKPAGLGDVQWQPVEELEQIPMPAPYRKAIRVLLGAADS